ncbi:hypothetical protein [Wielerella bovis]|nr:hypothetical protein [Wielerella bovis]
MALRRHTHAAEYQPWHAFPTISGSGSFLRDFRRSGIYARHNIP